MKGKTYKGSCLCGKVKFVARTPAQDIYFCHCGMCRKNYGMHGAFIAVPNDGFKVKNPSNVRWYASSKNVRRGFCKTCGSPIAWKEKGSTHTFFLAGLVEGKIGKKTEKHIFVKDKGDYYKIRKAVRT